MHGGFFPRIVLNLLGVFTNMHRIVNEVDGCYLISFISVMHFGRMMHRDMQKRVNQ